MDTQLFEDLKDSLRQAKAICQGKLEGRRTAVATIDIKAVRKQSKLPQVEFAAAMHVSVRTLQS